MYSERTRHTFHPYTSALARAAWGARREGHWGVEDLVASRRKGDSVEVLPSELLRDLDGGEARDIVFIWPERDNQSCRFDIVERIEPVPTAKAWPRVGWFSLTVQRVIRPIQGGDWHEWG